MSKTLSVLMESLQEFINLDWENYDWRGSEQEVYKKILIQTKQLLTELSSLKAKMAGVKGIWPEEKELTTLDALGKGGTYAGGWNACRQQVALNVIAVSERLEEKLAQVYCLPQHSKKELDANLLKDIAAAIRKELI